MDTQKVATVGINFTPSKPSRKGGDDGEDFHPVPQSQSDDGRGKVMLVSPAISFLARKTTASPPVRSIKPRRASGLFSSSEDQDCDRSSSSSSSKRFAIDKKPLDSDDGPIGFKTDGTSSITLLGEDPLERSSGQPSSHQRVTDSSRRRPRGQEQEPSSALATAGAAMCFSSPSRLPRGEGFGSGVGANAGRFTPQRNLRGLFVSPSPKADMAPTSAFSSTIIPRQCDLLKSPGWEEPGEWIVSDLYSALNGCIPPLETRTVSASNAPLPSCGFSTPNTL